MAKRLPLYPDKRLPVEQEEPRDLNSSCKRCNLHKNSRNVCLPAIGEPGGILIVGDWPTKHDDASGRPFASKRGKYAHRVAKRYYKGPIAFDNALRCLPNKGKTKLPNNAIDKCRGYLTQTINEVRPKRVILSGPRAVAAVYGESVQPISARRSIGWLWNDGEPVPVFIVLTPGQAISNTFLQTWFEKDMKWALTCDLDKQWMPPYDGYANVVETAEDVEQAIDDCYEANGFTYDVETVGRHSDDFFKIVSLSVTPYGSDIAWVFKRHQLEKKKFIKPLVKMLEDDELPKTGTNVKFDHEAVEYYLGAKVRGTHIDARLVRKLLFSDASGYLSDMAFLIGMGGHKREADRYLTKAKSAISKARDKSNKAAFLPGIVEEEIEEACKTTLTPAVYAYGLLPDEVLWRYNALDTITTDRLRQYVQKRLNKKKHVRRVWRKIVSRAPEAVTKVELWGMPIDRQSVVNYDKYLDEQLRITSKVFKKVKAANGQVFNPDSAPQVVDLLFNDFGLPVLVKTDGGEPSTAKGVLENIMRLTPGKAKMDKRDLRDAQKIVKALLEYRALSKLKGTYAEGMFAHIRSDGRVHPSLNIDGASSGRTSCVIGSTPIVTDRGLVAMQDVKPGMHVLTHKGRFREVTHQWEVGEKPVVELTLSNGEVMVCTTSHRLLTPDGWVRVEDIINGCVEILGKRQEEYRTCVELVPEYRATEPGGCSGASRDNVPQRTACCEAQHARSRAQGTQEGALLAVETGCKEPDEGEDWQEASQLEGCVRGQTRLPDVPPQRQEAVRAPGCCGEGAWDRQAPEDAGRTPHRWGHAKQRAGQPGPCHQSRTCEDTRDAVARLGVVTIEKISHSGSATVFDCTVVDDESYAALGIYSHNCSDPNLQNIPRGSTPAAQLARACYIAPPGRKIIQLDYSTLEYRIAAMLSGDKVMIDMFKRGADFHMATAQMIARSYFGVSPEEVTKEMRSQSKCFHPDTEVLTKRGWVRIEELHDGEEVAQADIRGEALEKCSLSWVKPIEVFNAPNPHGELVHLQNEGMDLRVTPDHMMLVLDAASEPKWVFPEEVAKAPKWVNAAVMQGGRAVDETLLRLAVAAQADGSIGPYRELKFGFSKKRKIERLTDLLNTAGITYTISKQARVTSFYIQRCNAAPVLQLLDADKTLPWWWLELTVKCRKAVLDEAQHWDGHTRSEWTMFGYYTTVQKNADVMQAIGSITGRKTRLTQGNTLRLSVKAQHTSRGGNLRCKRIPHTSYVSCLCVPSATILVRDGAAKIPCITKQTFNFALLYGKTDRSLAGDMGCTVSKAAELRSSIMGEWSDLDIFLKECIAFTERTGKSLTWWDGANARERSLYRIGNVGEDSDSRGKKITAKNGAINSPVQGCLPHDTKILTAAGYLAIGDAPLNGIVWDGHAWAPYTKLDRGEAQLAELELDNGQVLKCDVRHKVLTNNGDEYAFKAFDDLEEGDLVCFSPATALEFGAELNHEHMYWLGYACGNGSTGSGDSHPNALTLTFGDRKNRYMKEEKAAEFVAYCRDVLKIEPQKPRVFENKISVTCENRHLRELYARLGYCWGENAHNKILPSSIWKANLTSRKALLRGLFDANGTQHEDGCFLHLCQRPMLAEAQQLLRTCGVESKLRGPYTHSGFTSYRLDAVGSQMASELEFGEEKRTSISMPVPRSIVKTVVSQKAGTTPSHATLRSRANKGGELHAYTVMDMAEKSGTEVEVYAQYALVAKRALPETETTYTLSVHNTKHRFDSEGVISKNTASDYCISSLIECVDWLLQSRLDAKLVISVHDSLMFDVADDDVDEVCRVAHDIMLSHNAKDVPLKVDVEVGASWGSLEKYEIAS